MQAAQMLVVRQASIPEALKQDAFRAAPACIFAACFFTSHRQ
jgi:hypothetical protein